MTPDDPNLDDDRPPRARKPIPVSLEDDPEDGQINRINELTRSGRTNWFGLMAYLVFMMVTVLGVTDADFFIDSRQTQLPLVNVSIPTFSFFIFAPILGAALYVYLHLHIRKCTEALCAPPHRVRKNPDGSGGVPLENPVLPWLLNDMVLRMRGADGDGNRAAEPRLLDDVSTVTAFFLIWLAGPIVLLLAWLRSLPAHAEIMSLIILACALFCCFVGVTSHIAVLHSLSRDPDWLSDESRRHTRRTCWVALLLAAFTLIRTEIPVPGFRHDLMASAQLQDHIFAELPPGELDPDTARHRFRTEWCQRHGLKPDACGKGNGYPAPGFQAESRLRWCKWHPIPDDADCVEYFQAIDADFESEWTALRNRTIAALPKPDLSGKNIRNGNLRQAQLPGVKLDGATLESADLTRANLERASLSCGSKLGATGNDYDAAYLRPSGFEEPRAECRANAADLSGSLLDEVNFEHSNLQFANLAGTSASEAKFKNASMQGSNLSDAFFYSGDFRNANLSESWFSQSYVVSSDFAGAILGYSKIVDSLIVASIFASADMSGIWVQNTEFEGSDLSGVDMSHSELVLVKLISSNAKGVDLSHAIIHIADIRGSDLKGANWKAAELGPMITHGADLREALNLTQQQLNLSVGDEETRTPQGFYVWSCWKTVPNHFDRYLASLSDNISFTRSGGVVLHSKSSALESFVCPQGTEPQQTGCPRALDDDRPCTE